MAPWTWGPSGSGFQESHVGLSAPREHVLGTGERGSGEDIQAAPRGSQWIPVNTMGEAGRQTGSSSSPCSVNPCLAFQTRPRDSSSRQLLLPTSPGAVPPYPECLCQLLFCVLCAGITCRRVCPSDILEGSSRTETASAPTPCPQVYSRIS